MLRSKAKKERVKNSDNDEAVLKFLDKEIKEAIDRSFTILKTRIDQFGTSQPNIQRLQGTNRIQIEIPGADNPQRVRKLLQGVARLEFWEIVETYDPQLGQSLMAINQLLLKEQHSKKAQTTTAIKTDLTTKAEAKTETAKSALEKQLSNAGSDSTTKNSLDSFRAATSSPLFSLSTQHDA